MFFKIFIFISFANFKRPTAKPAASYHLLLFGEENSISAICRLSSMHISFIENLTLQSPRIVEISRICKSKNLFEFQSSDIVNINRLNQMIKS